MHDEAFLKLLSVLSGDSRMSRVDNSDRPATIPPLNLILSTWGPAYDKDNI